MRPWSTSVRSPPTAAATTGVPHAAASRATRPKDSERLGHEHDVGGAVVGGEQVVRARARPCGPGRSTPSSATSLSMRSTSAAPSAPLAPPTTTRRASGRRSAASARTATSRPLSGWMRPTKSSTGSVAEVEVVERGAGTVAGPGREEGVVDAGRHELDAAPVGAVEALELVGLGLAGGEDRVGAADHVGLGSHAALGLGVAGLGLHAGERVERRHERQVELVLEAVAGDAREPVVGVERVDVAEVARGGRRRRRRSRRRRRAAAPWPGRPARRRRGRPGSPARRRPPRATSRSARRVKTSACTPAWARADTSSRT